MSLLEDVFLQDEADEAQQLERVIEGDEYDEPRPSTPNSDENSEKEDEAEEDKRRVDPTKTKEKRVVKNPRLVLNPARLTGPRGIQIIPDHFKDFKFKGKGHEKEDLDLVLKRLEHWAYRLFPKFQFEDCLKKIETLGKKRPVMVHLHKIRTDQYTSEQTVVQRDSSDDEDLPMPPQEEDEFDKLLQQQIELARATPAPGSVKKGYDTPRSDRSLLMPKATSSPSISDEQRERMLRNRQLAEERRLAKLKHSTANTQTTQDNTETYSNTSEVNEDVAKKNRSNMIDSSDDEEVTIVNESITVDVHKQIEKPDGVRDEDRRTVLNNGTKEDKNTENNGISSNDNDFNEISKNISKVQKNIDNMNVPVEEHDHQIESANTEIERVSTEETELVNINDILDEVNDNTDKDDSEATSKKDSNIINDKNINRSNENNDAQTNAADKSIGEKLETANKSNEQKDNNIEDELDDIMDVDFSEDF